MFQVKLLLCFAQYHAINACIEPSLKQTQRLQIQLTQTAANGEFVVWNFSYINREILNTVRDSVLSLRKKLKKNTPHLNSVVHDTNDRKDVYSPTTSALQQLSHTPALTTDVYKQHTTACPLFLAAEVGLLLFANSAIYFFYTSQSFVAVKLSLELKVEPLLIEQTAMFPKLSSARTPLVFEK